jgi:hypothetical protein
VLGNGGCSVIIINDGPRMRRNMKLDGVSVMSMG